jgi:hypothetical protein
MIESLRRISKHQDRPFLLKEYYAARLHFPNTDMLIEISEDIIKQCGKMEAFLENISENQTKNKYQTEAIVNYFMGNPIRAFEIFDEDWEDEETTQEDIWGQYYFYKSAWIFYEDTYEQNIWLSAIEGAKQKIASNRAMAMDFYYTALLLVEHGEYSEALKYLKKMEDTKDFDDKMKLLANYVRLDIFYKNDNADEKKFLAIYADKYAFRKGLYNLPGKAISLSSISVRYPLTPKTTKNGFYTIATIRKSLVPEKLSMNIWTNQKKKSGRL